MSRKTQHPPGLLSLLTAGAMTLTSCPVALGQSLPAQGGAQRHDLPAQSYVDPTDKHFVSRFLKSGQYMTTQEIKAGMRGYGLTVFQGDRVERFDVTVIGVVKKVLSGRDAILVRLSGAPLGKNTVIRGMSGSPVYIGGKLVGAVSYGFDFSKEPIVGITPIVDMLDALALGNLGEGPSPAVSQSIELNHETGNNDTNWSSPGSLPQAFSAAGAPKMVRLMAPVSLAGFSPQAEEFLKGKLGRIGLSVSSGASGALDENLGKDTKAVTKRIAQAGAQPGAQAAAQAGSPITPGSAVSVLLTTGDFSSSATGTATATFGGHVLAFGHPFLQAGSVDFPMATSFIHKVLPNLAVSFKVASPVKVVGSIISDRPWSVGGELGRTSKMIPASYTVTDLTRNVKRQFKCEVVNHPDLTPELLGATAMSAIDSTHQSNAPYVVKVNSTITTDKAGEIKRSDCFSSNFAAHPSSDFEKLFRLSGNKVGHYLTGTVSKVIKNDFESANVKSVHLEITLEDGRKNALIERVYVDRAQVEPGDAVKVNCILRPYNKPRVTRTLSLKVPRDVPDGPLLIGVAPGDQMNLVRRRMGLSDPEPESLPQVVERLRETGRADSIDAVLALPEQSLVLNGRKLVGPPAHWLKLFFSDRYTHGPELTRGEIRTSRVEDYLLDGNHLISVEVKRPDKVMAQSTPYTVSAPAGHHSIEHIRMTEKARKTIETIRKHDASQGVAAQILSHITQQGKSEKAAAPQAPQTAWLSKKPYPHARAVLAWKQSTEQDFRNGESKEVSIDSRGRLYPGFHESAKINLSDEMQVFSGVYARGHFYFSLKNKIFKWKGDNLKPQLVQTFPSASFVPAMACDSKGTVYAALVPDGAVAEVNEAKADAAPSSRGKAQPKTKTKSVLKLDEHIITSLCFDDRDNLYAGAAGSGKVYRLDRATNETKLVFDSGQAHITSLFYSRHDSRMYVGTAEKGAVYSFDEKGQVRAEYQTDDHIVTGAVRDKSGNLYVTTTGQGRFIRVRQSGETDTIATSEAFYTLAYDCKTDTALAGDAEGDVTQARLEQPANSSYFVPVSHTDEEAVTSLALDGHGRLFVATSNLASLSVFDMKPSKSASYRSIVKDALRQAVWSRLRVFSNTSLQDESLDGAIKIETRTGMTARPDSSWSDWQAAPDDNDGFAIKSPPGRYLQYKISFDNHREEQRSKQPETVPAVSFSYEMEPLSVRRVEVTYQPANTAPYFSHISLTSGSCVSGKRNISVTGADQDNDNLLFSMELSADDGKTWQKLASDIRSKRPEPEISSKTKSQDKKDKQDGSPEDKEDDKKSSKVKTKKSSDKKSVTSSSSNKKSDSDTKGDSEASSEPEASSDSDTKSDSEASSEPDTKSDSAAASETKSDSESESSDESGKSATKTNARFKTRRLDQAADKSNKAKTDHPAGSISQGAAQQAASAITKMLLLQSSKAGKNTSSKSTSSTTESDAVEKFTYDWDTTKLKDGNYLVKLKLSDRLSSSENFSESERIGGIVVDNTPPKIDKVTLIKDSGAVKLHVKALDAVSPIVNATYKIDDGFPFAFSAATGETSKVLDALSLDLTAKLSELSKGSHKFHIEVQDQAGNTATRTVTLSQ